MIQVLPRHELMELKVHVGLHVPSRPLHDSVFPAHRLRRDCRGPLMTVSYRLDFLLIATGRASDVPEPFSLQLPALAICDLLFKKRSLPASR